MKYFFASTVLIFLFLFQGAGHIFSQNVDFRKIAEQRLSKKGLKLASVCPVETNPSARRIFLEYGAIYVAENEVDPPPKCIFSNEAEVSLFQANADPKTALIDGVLITLQQPAMDALLKAREKAAKMKLTISPRGGSTAGKRTYEATEKLWDSRFLPGLAHWVKLGKLKQSEANDARRLSAEKQVEQVLEWENTRGLFFSKDFSKSILYSVAAPGASQHIAMLAIDVEQFADSRLRKIMAENGWFQTVKSDMPHFTYLGLKESELPQRGLKKVCVGTQDFWVPDFQ
jgi:hypothetical protein